MVAEPVLKAVYDIAMHFGEDFLSGDLVRVFVNAEEQRDFNNDFQTDLLDAVELITAKHKNAEYVATQIERMINKRQKISAVETRIMSEQAESGVYKKIADKYPKGTVLTVNDMRQLIALAVQTEMDRIGSVRLALSTEERFAEVAKLKSVKAAVKKDQIRLENGVVMVEVPRPLNMICSNWIALASETRTVNAKNQKVGVVL